MNDDEQNRSPTTLVVGLLIAIFGLGAFLASGLLATVLDPESAAFILQRTP